VKHRIAGLFLTLGSIVSPCSAAEAIHWKEETRVLVQPGGQYGRMARLDKETLLCAFTWKRALQIRRSSDQGHTWSDPQEITAWAPGSLANAELLVLKNGDVLAFFNRRPGSDSKEPHSIGCCRSTDRAAAWSAPITIYGGDAKMDKGCWEPAALELPDGRIAVWFANENPFPKSHEQEISITFSSDRGLTWTAPKRFSCRAGSRDGMPVPVLSADAKSIFVAIEDNGLSGAFKPVILTTPSAGSFSPIDARSPHRHAALATPLPALAYAGAPYLRILPGGSAVLSFQLADSGNMRESRMAVCLGDPQARSFGPPSFPFPAATGAPAQLWNALLIKNPKTVTAISETTLDSKPGIWAIDGEILNAP
jgi:hypothetical protein